MEHNEAVQSGACEKYLLGELSAELRSAYEEHYFSCADCALQLRSSAEFFSGARQALAGPAVQADYIRAPRGWFPWMNPWVVGPVFAALLLLIGYQNLVTIPDYKQFTTSTVLPMFSLISANTRGNDSHAFPVPPNQPFGVYVDVPYDSAYSVYLLRLESPSGSATPLPAISAEQAQKTQVITINPGKQEGKYTIIVSGLANSSAALSSAKEIARLQFSVELRK